MARQVWKRAAAVLLVALVTATGLVVAQTPANARIVDTSIPAPVNMRGCATVGCVVTGGDQPGNVLRNVCYVRRNGEFWDLIYNKTTLNAGFIPESRLSTISPTRCEDSTELPFTSAAVNMRGCATVSCVVTGGTAASHVLRNGCWVHRGNEFWDLVYNSTTLNAGFIPEDRLTSVSIRSCG